MIVRLSDKKREVTLIIYSSLLSDSMGKTSMIAFEMLAPLDFDRAFSSS